MIRNSKIARLILGAILGASIGCVTGCASNEGSPVPAEPQHEKVEQLEEAEPEPDPFVAVTNIDTFSVDGLYLDSSYQDPENPNAVMLYAFYTASGDDAAALASNCAISLKVFDEQNLRNPTGSGSNVPVVASASEESSSSSCAAAVSYKPYASLLEPGRFVTFQNSNIPGIEALVVPTEEIVVCSSLEEIAQLAGASELLTQLSNAAKPNDEAHQLADAETAQAVIDAISGWEFYAYYGSLPIKFYFEAPNYFEERSSGTNNGGTFVVQKGYIACTYDNGKTVDFPWSWKDGETVEIDLISGVGL